MIHTKPHPDIVRTTLAVLFIALLTSASFWILRPFFSALIWATMIVVTTWPLMLSIKKRLWGKRALAVTVMIILLLLVFIIPCSVALLSIIDRSDEMLLWAKSLANFHLPPPPEWLEKLPVVGPKLALSWRKFASISQSELSDRVAPYAKGALGWFLAQAGSVLMIAVQFLVTVIISAVLYASGDKAAAGVCRFAHRLGGQNGEDAVILAGRAIRGVALGVVVTALLQAALGGIGLFIACIPAAALLTAVIFVLCIAQVGPMLVFIPVIIWLYWQGQTLWGSIMVVWAIVVGTMDNFIRPVLIKKGADLPLILIFAGVIGGLIAFGVVGLFIGPVMLAVTYTLLSAWVAEDETEEMLPEEGREGRA